MTTKINIVRPPEPASEYKPWTEFPRGTYIRFAPDESMNDRVFLRVNEVNKTLVDEYGDMYSSVLPDCRATEAPPWGQTEQVPKPVTFGELALGTVFTLLQGGGRGKLFIKSHWGDANNCIWIEAPRAGNSGHIATCVADAHVQPHDSITITVEGK